METYRRTLLWMAVLVVMLPAATAMAEVIVNDVGELNWQPGGGSFNSGDGVSSQVEDAGQTLVITTNKNRDIHADLTNPAVLDEVGDSISVSFDFQLEQTPTETSSSLQIGFIDSSTTELYGYYADLNTLGGTNGLVMSENGTDDPNLGKHDSNAMGATVNSMTFTLTRIASGTGLELTVDSALVTSSGTFSSEADTIPLPTTSFDRFFISFKGNEWNLDNDLTITSFTVDSNAVIPEPGSLMLTLFGAGLLMVHRRRIG